MKFRDIVEGTMDKKLLAAAEKLIIKMKKDKETNTKIIKALEINFPSLDALEVLGDFKNARVDESHFEIGDEVICKASGSEGKIVKIDEPEEGKYYTVELEDGTTKKYAPEELSLEDEDEDEDELEEARGTAAKYADKKGMMGGKYTSDDKKLDAVMKDRDSAVSKYADKKLAQRKADHMKTDPEFGKYHARNMVDTDKAEKKAAKKGIKNPSIDWKQKNSVKRGKLPESQDVDFVLQALADADINASIDGNIVMVDKSDVRGAQKVLKAIGCSRKVKAGLNEGEEDVIFSKEIDGQELKVHVHDGKFICKVNGKELK